MFKILNTFKYLKVIKYSKINISGLVITKENSLPSYMEFVTRRNR